MDQRAGCCSTGKTLPCLIRRKTSMPRRPARAPWTKPSRIFPRALDMRLPLADWLDSQFAKTLPERVRAAIYVEPSQIVGVPCDHLALRGDEADLQLWVAQGNQPLPRRLVITYK